MIVTPVAEAGTLIVIPSTVIPYCSAKDLFVPSKVMYESYKLFSSINSSVLPVGNLPDDKSATRPSAATYFISASVRPVMAAETEDLLSSGLTANS